MPVPGTGFGVTLLHEETAMKLESKGEVRPPPRLKGPAEAVSRAIRAWPGIVAATHWAFDNNTRVDGADFYVGARELGHIHLDGEVHLLLTPGLCRRLVAAGHAEDFPWADDWVQSPVASRADAARALWLFRLGYDRLTGTPLPELRRRIAPPLTVRPHARTRFLSPPLEGDVVSGAAWQRR
jgi:hypothetical protein